MPTSPVGDRIWDAVVVGAGPAGTTCALELARRGLEVVILEKASWPRYKTCGGGLIGRAVDLLEIDIEPAIERRTLRAELHLHDLGRVFHVEREHSLVSLCMRADLDDRLLSAACRAGSVFADECEIVTMQSRSDGWTLDLGDRSLTARYVVAADGAAGRVGTFAGWNSHRHLVPAIESEVAVDEATHRRFADTARFDFGSVPAGYAWVFPKAAHLSVGCLSYDSSPRLRQALDAYLDALAIRPFERHDHGFVIPVQPRAGELARNRVLLTGDAAGLADPVTCEGISNAIASGRLAATAIAESSEEEVTADYQCALETRILPDLRRARLLARLLYGAPRIRGWVFRHLGEPLTESMADLIAGNTTYRDLLGSPSRFLRAGVSLLWSTRNRPTQRGG